MRDIHSLGIFDIRYNFKDKFPRFLLVGGFNVYLKLPQKLLFCEPMAEVPRQQIGCLDSHGPILPFYPECHVHFGHLSRSITSKQSRGRSSMIYSSTVGRARLTKSTGFTIPLTPKYGTTSSKGLKSTSTAALATASMSCRVSLSTTPCMWRMYAPRIIPSLFRAMTALCWSPSSISWRYLQYIAIGSDEGGFFEAKRSGAGLERTKRNVCACNIFAQLRTQVG